MVASGNQSGIVNWGVLSTARIADKVIDGINTSRNGRLAAVASRDAAKARAFAAKHGAPGAYGSYEELLADPAITAVYNPLPNNLHAEWTMKAAAAGKHVLCEKPLASDAAEAAEAVAFCRERGVLLMEAFMYRFHPLVAEVRRRIAEGAIGDVHTVRGAFSFELHNTADIRLQPDMAGGALMDVGCYPVNLARLIFGAEPERVFAIGHFREDSGVDMTLTGLLQFSGDRTGVVECSFDEPYRCEYEIVGSKGRIRVADGFVRTPVETGFDILRGDQIERVTIAPAHVYRLQAEYFADCVLHSRPIGHPAEDGLANMRVLTALLRSADEERAVPVERD